MLKATQNNFVCQYNRWSIKNGEKIKIEQKSQYWSVWKVDKMEITSLSSKHILQIDLVSVYNKQNNNGIMWYMK